MTKKNTTPAVPEIDPETFNLDEWLTDAALPERSVTVYKRADLLARMDELERAIDISERAGAMEDTMDSDTEELVSEYQALAEEFAKSALTIRVRGLLSEELTAISQKAAKNKWPLHVTGIHMIAKAIVSPNITLDGLFKLDKTIGSAQIGRLSAKVNEATNTMPQVNSAFLQKFSGQESGRE